MQLQGKVWGPEFARGWFFCLIDNCAHNESARRLMSEDERVAHLTKMHSPEIKLKKARVMIMWNMQLGVLDTDIGKMKI